MELSGVIIDRFRSVFLEFVVACFYLLRLAAAGAIKAFKRGLLYHGEDCNRGPKNDPPILEPAFLLVNR